MDKETKNMLEAIVNKLDKLENGMDNRLDRLEGRQDEIYTVVKSIEHSNEVHEAEMDQLNIRISKSESNLSRIKTAIK